MNAKVAPKKKPSGKVFDLIKSALVYNMSKVMEDYPPVATVEEATKQVVNIISIGLSTNQYSYDPTAGIVEIRLNRPFDFFQKLIDGEELYIEVRKYLIDVEQWDEVDFINSRTGVGYGSIKLHSHAICAAKLRR